MSYNWSDSPLLKPGETDFYNAIYRAPMVDDTVLLPHQQRYVKRIVDEVLSAGHDHVLFQIDNESGIGEASLEPDPYALAEQGKQYVVYFTGKGDRSVVIDLSGLKGIATERWLDVEHSTWLNETTLRSAELRPLSAPGPGQWAVLIRMTQAAVPEF